MRVTRLIFSSLASLDWILVLVTAVLAAVGLSAIYSIDLSRGETLQFFPTQAVAAGLGIFMLFAAASFHPSIYKSGAIFFYVAGIILLIAVLFFGVTIRGTTGWFRIFGFSFQPAEFAKVALVIFLGWWIDKHKRRFEKWQFVFTSGLATLIIAACILLQPDAGSALIVSVVWFCLLLISGTKKRFIIFLLGVVAVMAVFGWMFFLKEYQKHRILNFLDPTRDPLGTGYNVTQSIIAVGSGQFFGRGLGFGSQSQLHFLPEAQTDFIFSVISEELGFIGSSIVVILYTVLIFRLIRISGRCRDDFSAYTVLGIAVVFLIHFVVNIGGAIGLLPITGVTLPFISYGGSSLIMNFMLVGIAQSIHRASQIGYSSDEG